MKGTSIFYNKYREPLNVPHPSVICKKNLFRWKLNPKLSLIERGDYGRSKYKSLDLSIVNITLSAICLYNYDGGRYTRDGQDDRVHQRLERFARRLCHNDNVYVSNEFVFSLDRLAQSWYIRNERKIMSEIESTRQ